MKLYIYNLEELDSILKENVLNVPPEMNLFNLFCFQLKNFYSIVSNIEEADIAFIPIDYVKLIYVNNEQIFKSLPENLPIKPPTFGSKYKKDFIDFFWKGYIKKHIKNKPIPHFILYTYVLFEVDFDDIPENVYIISYEKDITYVNTLTVSSSKVFNRTLQIPYILNKNGLFNQTKIENYYFESKTINEILFEKKHDVAFFGSINKRTENLYKYREFLLHFNQKNNFNYINGEGDKAEGRLKSVKYLFVLRGDTPTRLCFYQCFAFGVCPIIYENDFLESYSQLLLPNNIDLLESVLIIPNNVNNLCLNSYCDLIENILEIELSNELNYINKIKNHKTIFDNFNYFTETLCNPVKNVLEHLRNK
jgi:hypothetical protein